MRFSFVAVIALVAPAVFAASIPSAGQVQDALSSAADQVADQLRFNFDDGDSCGSFKVRCVRKDQKKVVGDIGKKEFIKDGLTCKQKHETTNKAECNAKYPVDCAAKCDAVGSPL
ncbi:hypothetical protein NBRC10513v2_005862 [Rhodotorula toruloides]|uniref:Uncharacterized protein n=1 Tax=Rhodotorula toruloides TaxID=5286 RepID=A0A0K3CJW9_RHOTO|nr:hypothetical protein AAT19DRAFT_14797 [Rhodotorula toruloides]